MRRPIATVFAAAIAVATACAGTATAADHPANVQWETYLPAMDSPRTGAPTGVPFCRTPSIRCIDVEIRRLRNAQRNFGCDHRAVFATTYLELTRQLRADLRRYRKLFRWRRYLLVEDAAFANIYFNSLRAQRRGRPVPPAWRIAFDAARSRDVTATQDMLLGINAHVQNDMPFMLASLGLRTKKGISRKPDHDVMNLVLDRAYERVVAAVAKRYDPFVETTNSPLHPGDDVFGLEMVKEWRELVWRNAERLVNASSKAERDRVADQIKQNAAYWARMMATPENPGYRAQRDEYCAARLK